MPPQSVEGNECPICRRIFKRNEHLIRHLRTHTQERPFGCPLCEKSFTRQDTLKRHLLGHADESSSDSNQQNSQLTHTAWTEPEQSFEPRLGSGNLPPEKAGNLDWFDALAATSHTDGASPSPMCHSHSTSNGPARDRMLSLMTDFDSSIAEQSEPPAVSARRASSVWYADKESPRSTNLSQSKQIKLPPELFNSMVDDYARKWLRDLCSK